MLFENKFEADIQKHAFGQAPGLLREFRLLYNDKQMCTAVVTVLCLTGGAVGHEEHLEYSSVDITSN